MIDLILIILIFALLVIDIIMITRGVREIKSLAIEFDELNLRIKYLDKENNRINNFLQVHDSKLQITDICLLRLADAVVEQQEEAKEYIQ